MKLGFIVPDLGLSHRSYALTNAINKFYEGGNNSNIDVAVFCENRVEPRVEPYFATFNVTDAYAYAGPMVATSLSTAKKILSFPQLTHRIFYIWSLEWFNSTEFHFRDISSIYQNNELEIITRSEEHKYIFEKVWNKEVSHVVEDFNLETLIKIIGKPAQRMQEVSI
jgi:hypothetical protein